ncbi:MAG: recombinase family protein [Clostridia bacterium]|nr:recombinase family protein [Clostridia bacterium]
MITYGYARVSSRDQNLARQIAAFSEFGVKKRNIFSDKESGKNFERKNYLKLISRLKKGDLLVIKSIDRLGRNYNMILQEWTRITKKICADIVVLDMPLLDTRERADSLVGKFIADIVLQVLSFVAENERANIKVRQAEGIAEARKKGVKFGRPKTVYGNDFGKIAERYFIKEIDIDQALKLTGLKKSNFYYHIKQYRRQKGLTNYYTKRTAGLRLAVNCKNLRFYKS